MKTRLQEPGGAIVAEGEIPAQPIPPGVILMGARAFVYEGTPGEIAIYTERTLLVVQQAALPSAVPEP